jgi:hypothetical protein
MFRLSDSSVKRGIAETSLLLKAKRGSTIVTRPDTEPRAPIDLECCRWRRFTRCRWRHGAA